MPEDSLSDASLPYGPMRYRIARTEIAYLSSVFESYEDFGAVRTVDPVAAIVEILYAPDFYEDVLELMGSLGEDIPSLARIAL